MSVKNQILKLRNQGMPIKTIARSLAVSKNTVKSHMKSLNELDENEVLSNLRIPNWALNLDIDLLVSKRRQGVTSKQLFEENAPGISYWTFNRLLKKLLDTPKKISLHLSHIPAEMVQIDYCDGITIVKNGKKTKTQLFVAVLHFSSYVFAEFTLNQKQESFLRSQEKMWSFFGGVTPYTVIDNLKSGVKKAHKYDPEANPTFVEFCNHYNTAVLPARPYTPKDKACVEANIGVIQKTFYSAVHDKTFSSLAELNRAFSMFLQDFNQRIMKDYGISRKERFLLEKDSLLSLPGSRWVPTEWKISKVHPDCCIQVDYSYYSVPFKLVGQSVRVRMGPNMVEIFDDQIELITSHPRSTSKGKYVTREEHFPTNFLQLNSFEVRRAKAKAQSYGGHIEKLIFILLDGDRPLRRLRCVQGILRLLRDKKVSIDALEFACKQAETFNKYYLSFLTQTAIQFDKARLIASNKAPNRPNSAVYLRSK